MSQPSEPLARNPVRGTPIPSEPAARNEWLLAELARPETWPGSRAPVETRRTLVSLLAFVGSRAYKVKQALDLGFLDATTLERRRHLCDEEVRLNAALAPGIHLGVVPLTLAADGHLALGGSGPVVEWAVEMVRLPAERMLARLLERGALDNAELNALVALLVDFHAAAATGPGVDEFGTAAGVGVSVEENFEQLEPFARREGVVAGGKPRVLSPAQHVFLRARARAFLTGQGDLLRARVAAGRIREGHGDLHAENVCRLPTGFVIYDRIEFNRRFRCLDVANDLAFLAMDLDLRGYPGFAGYLAHRYAEVARDPDLPRVIGFYKGYRALVRAKVAALSADRAALAPEAREALRREAMRYAQLALGYELRPSLILLAGLPASGKTTLARQLAPSLRAPVFHSDERRKRLAGVPARDSARAAWGQGLYTREARQETYRSLLADALETLRGGRSVVVDASFARRAFRRPFLEAAVRLGLPFCFVCLQAPEEVVRARLRSRTGDASDADFEVYLREREAFEPLEEVPAENVLTLGSHEGAAEDLCARVLERMVERALESAPAPGDP